MDYHTLVNKICAILGVIIGDAIPLSDAANVFSHFEALQGASGTFFMLDQFQTENEQGLWGDEEPNRKDPYWLAIFTMLVLS